MKTPYKLSKDYDKLFHLICDENIIAGFVDYSWSDGEVVRDICSIIRREENNISIGARGIGYASIHPFTLVLWKMSEKECFISSCKSCNLEWIDANFEQKEGSR